MATGYWFPKNYLWKNGVMILLQAGESNEFAPDYGDLYQMHKMIMKRKPRVVLEFGVGFSTITIAKALATLGRGHLYSVDTSEQWLENTRQKLGDLQQGVTLWHSKAEVCDHDGQLACRYTNLPDITPDFIYLDGPSPLEIQGNIRGLGFGEKEGAPRQTVAADILLYESTMLVGSYILTDRRYINVQFLINNLKRKWRIRWDRVQHQVGFELREITAGARRLH